MSLVNRSKLGRRHMLNADIMVQSINALPGLNARQACMHTPSSASHPSPPSPPPQYMGEMALTWHAYLCQGLLQHVLGSSHAHLWDSLQ